MLRSLLLSRNCPLASKWLKADTRLAFFLACLTFLIAAHWLDLPITSLAHAQSDPSEQGVEYESGSATANSGFVQGDAVNAGGMSMADFQSLIMLIQNTIDPDSWLDTGTGTSTVFPYPSGVFVDPKGQLQRKLETDATLQFANHASVPRHPFRDTSSQRTISLKALDQALARLQQTGMRPTREMQQLAGLSRIDIIKIDVPNEDILISGPANSNTLGFALEDLAIVTASIDPNTDPLGCSIDPSDAGLLAAQQLLGQAGSIERLARNPKSFVAQLQEKIGDHRVSVFGLNPKSGTALAMIDADEHMKRLGFGLEKTSVGLKSYFEHLEELKSVSDQSLVRWWFAYADSPIRVNPQQNVFKLPEQCVCVMSEQQFVTQQGRVPSGGQDVAADAFASEMSQQLSELRETHRSYARLCSVYEMALSLQLALVATQQPSFAAWFPSLHAAGQTEYESDRPEPKTVAGLTTWHKMKSGTIVAVVSGGVTLNVKEASARSKWQDSALLSGSVVPDSPALRNTAHAQWWWD